MKKVNIKKKAILLLYSYLLMLLTPKTNAKPKEDITYNIEYNINNNNLFASYNNKEIYIGKKNILIPDEDDINIYIYDARNNQNPDMAIHNSYRITKIEDIDKILKIITEYEKMYPSNWNRTISSMKNEWIIHNICYYLNIEQDRTKEVDLDNMEEEKYRHFIKILIEILNNHSLEESNNKKLILKK